jgi:hypothetical protein
MSSAIRSQPALRQLLKNTLVERKAAWEAAAGRGPAPHWTIVSNFYSPPQTALPPTMVMTGLMSLIWSAGTVK